MAQRKNNFISRALKVLGIVILGLFVFVAYVLWVNLSEGPDPKEILADLPTEIKPKYNPDENRNWWKSTSVYQVYPRSYKDSDGDGIGDIAGIIEKLDYIQSLGFETIWFSPFFKSPQQDHGYDVSDYLDVQPEYGALSVLDSLIVEVHRRDMKIVFDLVLNHTSIQHPWFQASKLSRDNPKSDWYIWHDGKDGGPPSNWKNILGMASAWNYSPERDQYYYAAFLPFQPDLNMANPEVRAEIFNIVRTWLDKGVDGFRLDIFNFIFEDEDLTNNPFTWRALPQMGQGKWMFEDHQYNFHQPEVIAFAKELRAILESYPDGRFMVGEVFGSHRHMRELLGMEQHDGLNLVFIFDFLEQFEFSADYFREKAMEYEAFYPYPLVPTYVFSNHDQIRSITRLENSHEKAEVMAAFQLTMRGVPFVYQGEEIGMTTGEIPLEDAEDPLAAYWTILPQWVKDNVAIMWNRDNCRTPMQWSPDVSAGFSTNTKTWLPIQENYESINVQNQLSNEDALIHTYKDILNLRADSPALKTGKTSFAEKASLPDGILSYTRSKEAESINVYLNFSDQPKSIALESGIGKVRFEKRATVKETKVELGAFGILILEN